VQRVLRLQERANLAVFSVSALDARIPGHLYRAGYLQRDDLRQLLDRGVVGELATVFLRADGSSDSILLNARSSGRSVQTLKGIRRRLCVAVGAAKAPVTRAALLAGAVTDLVIDDAAAELLVD
jgi:DNA-binding transcriptional regulator LsrR (DeoR family)